MPITVGDGRKAEYLRLDPGLLERGTAAIDERLVMPALQGFMSSSRSPRPTIGLSKSPSAKPTARSIARFGERATPCVMSLERRFAGEEASSGSALHDGSLGSRTVRGRDDSSRALADPIQSRWFCNTFIGMNLPTCASCVFHRGCRAPAFRPRRRGAAHFAAAVVTRDPVARGAARGCPLRAHAPACRADRGGRTLPRRGAPPRGASSRPRDGAPRHGPGERGRLRIGFVSLADYGVLPAC